MRLPSVAVCVWVAVQVGGACTGAPRTPDAPTAEDELLALARAVQDADFRGDAAALDALHARMGHFLGDQDLARDARYWRGFALWRRALNGANAGSPPDSLLGHLDASADDFREALRWDPDYREATIGLAAVLMNAAHFRYRGEPVRSTAQMTEALRLVAEVRGADPANPRLVFVAAGRTFWAPREAGGDRARAVAEVEAALASLQSSRTPARPLEPAWGEAELHMQLAFFRLNVTPPDLSGALQSAQTALALHPEWDYVKRILLPQIERALSGESSSGVGSRNIDARPMEATEMAADAHAHHEIDCIELAVTDIARAQRFYATAFDSETTDYGPGYAGVPC